jgi:hypothetical protein
MDIFLQDPNEIPLPPNDVKILDFKATPYQDGRRVKVYIEVTPFQKRPNIELTVVNQNSNPVAEVNIIESMTRKIELTIHLREPEPSGAYQVYAVVFYTEKQIENESQEAAETGQFLVADRGLTGFDISITTDLSE